MPLPDAVAPGGPPADPIERIRAFNRSYTRRIGIVREGVLRSEFNLPQARILLEAAHRPGVTAGELSEELGMDPGYLSRLLRAFEERGLIRRRRAPEDGRRRGIALEPPGEEAFETLDRRAREEIGRMVAHLGSEERLELVRAMERIEELLSPDGPGSDGTGRSPAFVLRPFEPGDIGRITWRHAVLYQEAFGWGADFEVLVGRLLCDFVEHQDPERERGWVAELDGRFAGTVFVARESETVARLRCLLVEPFARGRGLGGTLVGECLRFARLRGYRRMTLWTNDVLHAARRIYERAGFRLTSSEPHDRFGDGLIGQTWDLEL